RLLAAADDRPLLAGDDRRVLGVRGGDDRHREDRGVVFARRGGDGDFRREIPRAADDGGAAGAGDGAVGDGEAGGGAGEADELVAVELEAERADAGSFAVVERDL